MKEHIETQRRYPQGVPPTHTRRGPRWSPQIRGNNPLDFSVVLVISGCNVQSLEGDFSGEQGRGLLPETKHPVIFVCIQYFNSKYSFCCDGISLRDKTAFRILDPLKHDFFQYQFVN